MIFKICKFVLIYKCVQFDQCKLDDRLPRHGVFGCQPSVVDMGGGGCFQKDKERCQNCSEGLCQEDAFTD